MSGIDSEVTRLRKNLKRAEHQVDRLSVLVIALFRMVVVDLGAIDLVTLDDYIDEINRLQSKDFDLHKYLKEKLESEGASISDLIKKIKIKDLTKEK